MHKRMLFAARKGLLGVLAVSALAALSLSLTTCDVFKSGLGPKVDVTPPEVTITSPLPGAYVRGTFVLSGTATDDISVSSLVVSYPAAGGGTAEKPITISSNKWTVSLPSGVPGGVAEGKGTITVTAKAPSGKASSASVLAYVDNTPPTVLVTTPTTYGITPPIYSTYVDIDGEAYDASPISSVSVTLSYIDATGPKSVTQTANGTNSWSVRFLLKGFLSPVDASILHYSVIVTDIAGNASTYYYHSQDIYGLLALFPGKLFPTMLELGQLDQGGTSPSSPTGITIAQLSTYPPRIDNAQVNRGNLQYSNAFIPTIQYSNLDPANPPANVLAPGAVIVGNVIPPANAGAVDPASLVFKIFPSSSFPAGSPAVTLTAASPLGSQLVLTNLGSSQSFKIALQNSSGTNLPPGQYVLDVTAQAFGSGTAHGDVNFGIDSSAPTLTETSIGNSLALCNNPFSLSGLAASLSGLSTLLVEESADGGQTWSTAYNKTYAGSPTTDNWSTPANLPIGGSDGSYTYRITLVTSSGLTAIIYRSVIFDHTPPYVNVTSPTPGTWTSSSSLALSGTAGDGSGSGVSSVYYLVDSAANDHSAEIASWASSAGPGAPTGSWSQAGGIVSSWTGSLTLSGEGYKRLWVVAVDLAGNRDSLGLVPAASLVAGKKYTIDTLGTTNFTTVGAASNTVGVTFTATGPGAGSGIASTGSGEAVLFGYDQSPPTLSEAHPASNNFTAATAGSFLGFNGNVSDSDALAGLSVQYSKNGVPQSTVPIIPSGTTWTWTPFASGIDVSGHTNDGSYAFAFTAIDIAGKTTTLARTITIDTDPPATAVTSPSSGGWVSTTALSVTGTASDGTGSGVSQVYLKVDSLYVAASPTDHSAEDPTVLANGWTVATGLTNWSSTFTLSVEGRKTLWIKAADAVGNITTPAGAVSSRVDFGLDLNPPTLGFTDAVGTLVSAAFTLDGTTTDTNPAGAPTLAVTVDGGASQAITVAAGAWTFPVAVNTSTHANDGSHTYVLTATDVAGKTTTLSRTITIDTTPPTTIISQPGSYTAAQPQYWLSGATASLGGSAVDPGVAASGVAKVYFKVDSLGNSHAADNAGIITSTWTLAAGTSTWSTTYSLVSEGQFTLWIAAFDNAGNLSSIVFQNFGVDQSPPTLTETNHPATSATKSAFTLAGAIGDTNALASLTVTESRNAGPANPVTFTSIPASLPGVKSAAYTSQSLPLGGVIDGSYAYVLTATDAAGKTTVVDRTVTIDTTPPTVNLTAIPSWVSSSAYTISGSATDPNLGASGVAVIQYQLDGGAWTNAVWVDTSGGANTSGTWSATLSSLAEGNHSVVLRATDAAANTTTLGAAPFGVDLSPPTVTETALGTTSQVTKNAAFTMTGTVSDSNPVSVPGTTLTVSVSVNGGAALPAAMAGSTWSFTQLKVDGTYSYVITATDVSGKTATLNRLVLLDSTPPALSVVSPTPAPGTWVSSTTVSISGASNDGAGSGVKNTYYLVDIATNDHSPDIAAWNLTSGASAPTSGTSATWAAATGLPGSWTGSTTLAGEGARILWIVSADKAGNTTALSRVNAGSFNLGTVYTIAAIGTTDFTTIGASSNTVGLSFTASGPGSGTGSAWAGTGIAIPFGLDLNPPALTETAVNTTSTVVRNSSVNFSGSASDTNALAAAHALTLSIDGAAADDVSFTVAPSWSYTYLVNTATHAQDGLHNFLFAATDIAGKTTSVVRSILVDTTPASVVVTSPGTGTWTGASPYTVTGTASDGAGAGVSQVWTIVDVPANSHATDATGVITGGAWKLATGTSNWTTSWALAPAEGSKTLWVAVLDAAGNWSVTPYTAVNFGYDATPPALTIAAMGGYRVPFAITGTVSDAASGVASLQYKIDSGTFTAVTIAASWTSTVPAAVFSSLAEGSHTVTVQATDNAGNQTTQASTFSKDTTPPALTYSNISAGGGTVDQDSNPVLSGTLADVSGVASATYTLQVWSYSTQTWNAIATGASLGSPAGATSWSWSLDLSASGLNLPDGKYQIAIGAADVPGNTIAAPVQVPFFLSRTSPGITVAAPSLGTFQDAGFPLAGTASDSNSVNLVRAKIASGSVDFSSGATAALPALAVTAAIGTPGIFTTNVPHGLNVGDQVYLWGTPMPTTSTGSVSTGTAYVVQSSTAATFTIATTSAPTAALAITTSTATNLIVAASKFGFPTFHPAIPVSVSGNTMTANNHQLANGDVVYFQGTTLPAPTTAATACYVVNSAANTFQVSMTSGGSVLPLTTSGTAVSVYSPTHPVSWLVPGMPVSGFTDGPLTGYVQVTAGSSKTSQTSRDFTLDTAAPVISLTSPASGTRWVGNLTLNGTTTDPGSIPSGVTGTIQYQIGTGFNLTNPSSWSNANVTGGAYSWTITLGDMSSYANATYATQCDSSGNPATGTNLWKLPIVFQALDKAGNIAQMTSYFLILDPNGNLPVVNITQPATGLTFGGQQRVTGTASQPTWIYGVEVAVDPTGGSNFPANPVGVSIAGATLTSVGQPFTAGQMVFLSGTTAPQIGGTSVVPTTAYWVVNPSANSFQVSASSGGSPVSFSSSGTGVTASVWGPATLTTTGNNVIWYYDVNTTTAYPQNAMTSQTISLQARAWNSPTPGGAKGTLSGTLPSPWILTFNSSFPQIQNIQVTDQVNGLPNTQTYFSQMTTRGTINLTGTVSSSKGISKIESVESSPLSGATSLYNTSSSYGVTAAGNGPYWSSTVTPATQYTAGSFPFGGSSKLLITSLGSTDWVSLGAPVAAIGTVFSPSSAGTGTGTAIASDSSGNFNYAVAITLSSAALYNNTTGQYAFNFRLTDMTSPTPQVSTSMITLNEDNYYPTSSLSNPSPVSAGSLQTGVRYMILTVGTSDFTAVGATSNTVGLNFVATGPGSGSGKVVPVLTGIAVKIQGSATDTGTGSGPIQGLSKVIVYLTNTAGTQVLDIKNGGGAWSAPVTLQAMDMANGGTVGSVVYPNTAAYSNFFASIDTLGMNGTVNPHDGFVESLMLDGNDEDWWVQLDTTKQNDGPVTVNFVVWDAAGNPTHYAQSAFISNNAPALSTITLGTDLTGAGSINATQTVATGFAATGFTGRNKLLSFTINSLYNGNNGALGYSLVYAGHDYLNPAGQAGVSLSGVTTNSETVTLSFAALSPSISDTVVSNGASFTIKVTDQTPGSNQSYAQAIALNIHNNDTIAPTISVAPFGQVYSTPTDASNGGVNTDTGKTLGAVSAYNANIGASGGHIEYVSPITAGASAVSGQVVIKGKTWDDLSLQKITAAIPGFNGGAGPGAEFTIGTYSGGILNGSSGAGWTFAPDAGSQSLSLADGHVLNWSFTWDSSLISTVAAANVTVTFKAYNNGSPSLSGSASTVVDIVPYVTGVSTALSNAYSSNPSIFNRSALGAYPVSNTGSLTLTGYNLYLAGSTTVTMNGSSAFIATSAPSKTSLTETLSAGATSGPFNLTVSGVQVDNNINNNNSSMTTSGGTTVYYNQVPNGVNNPLLTDDLTFKVWSFTTVASSATQAFRYPSMRVSSPGSGSKVGFAYDYGAQEVHVNSTGTGDTKIDGSFTQWYDTGLAYDGSGNFYAIGVNGDSGGTGNGSFNQTANTGFYAWQAGSQTGDGSTGTYTRGTYKALIESAWNGTVFNSDRVQQPKIAATGTVSPYKIYMTYYDASQNQLTFRYGTVATGGVFAGDISDQPNSGVGSAANAQAMATSASTYGVGLYSAVGVTSGGVAVAAWYDQANQRLVFSFNTAPTLTTSAGQWQANASVIDASFAGWHVDLAVDAADGIHIAYYNSSSGDLKYAYLSAYNAAPQVTTVDSFLSTGTDISITTYFNGTNYVPYISYFMPTFTQTSFSVRTAWRTNFASLQPGATNDQFTGNWEVMTVPTASYPQDFRIGLGVKPNASAVNSPLLGYATKNGSTYTLETAQLQ